MTYFSMTEEQVLQSEAAACVDKDVALAIRKAQDLAERGGCNMTVVRTSNHGVCIYSDFQMNVRKGEIVEEIYSTDNGFSFPLAA